MLVKPEKVYVPAVFIPLTLKRACFESVVIYVESSLLNIECNLSGRKQEIQSCLREDKSSDIVNSFPFLRSEVPKLVRLLLAVYNWLTYPISQNINIVKMF